MVYLRFSFIVVVMILLACRPSNGQPIVAKRTVTTLTADGSRPVAVVIAEKGFATETPNDEKGSHPDGMHISQQFDDILQKDVFVFDIHLSSDNDSTGTATDRQRNELKTWEPSPAYLKGERGETHTYRWKFKLPNGFMASPQFTHIHQLKAVGGDAGNPTITLTPRQNEKGQTMQVVYRAPGKSVNRYLAEVPLLPFLGQWVQAEETVTYSEDKPAYQLTIKRLSDGQQLLSYSYNEESYHLEEPFVMIRSDNNFVRPKWGIYRAITNNGSPIAGLRNEQLLFADFEVEEVIN